VGRGNEGRGKGEEVGVEHWEGGILKGWGCGGHCEFVGWVRREDVG